MKSPKPLGLLLVAAAAVLMTVAGSASATVVTSLAGTTYTSSVLSSSEAITLEGPYVTIQCKKSILQFKIENHGSATTAGGNISGLGFSECNYPSTGIPALGSVEIHTQGTSANGNGTLTWSGGVFTFKTSIGECGFTTTNTDIGVLTGSKNTGATAQIDITAVIPRTHGNFLCGSTGTLRTTYTINTPDYLDVD